MKKIVCVLAVLLCICICISAVFCGCDGYTDSYSAVAMVRSVQRDEASWTFGSFDGTLHFKLKAEQENNQIMDYEASLGEGEMNIYIDADGEKELLFTIKGGETLDAEQALGDTYNGAKTIRVIAESVGKCKDGNFKFDLG